MKCLYDFELNRHFCFSAYEMPNVTKITIEIRFDTYSCHGKNRPIGNCVCELLTAFYYHIRLLFGIDSDGVDEENRTRE